jgi:(4-(4-[2-(gamma-L-glutamylamino)ethyl]phenoxymethyl)furan-2-yl)methanamine synthase
MADVHRILGSLPDGADQMESADSRAKTVAASQARLARMVGRDVDDADASAWTALAQYFAEAQIRAITDGGMLVLSEGQLPANAPIVAAGIGAGLLQEVARRLSRDCIEFEALINITPGVRTKVSSVAPAAAVAILGSVVYGGAEAEVQRAVASA